MSRSRHTTLALDRNDAAFQERVADQWRDWVAYLRAHQTLVDAQRTTATAPLSAATFELDDEATAVARAQKTLAGIAPARRALFDAERERARQELQGSTGPSTAARDQDPLDQEHAVLATLLREALGEETGQGQPAGRGLVPLGDDQWYSVDIAALEAAPSAAAYALADSSTSIWRRRLQVALVVTALFVVGMAGWWLWPRSFAAARPALALTVNGAALEPWPVATVLVGHGTLTTTFPLTRTQAMSWPAPPLPQTGYVRRGSVWPLVICLPAETLAAADALVLPGNGRAPTRHYTLQPAPSAPLDLLAEPCAADSDPLMQTRYGVLTETRWPTPEALNEPVAIATETTTATLTIHALTAVGRGEDTTLPAGQMQVTVAISGPAALDWPRLAPTLWLPDGSTVLPSETVATGPEAWALRYLVPDQTAPLAVAWTISAGERGPLRWWRTIVNPPLTRDAVLRHALVLIQATLTTGTENDATAPVLQLTVRNQGATRLSLTSDDLQLWVGATKAATPDVAALRAPIPPGAERVVPISLPAGWGDGGSVTVAIGPQRVQVRR